MADQNQQVSQPVADQQPAANTQVADQSLQDQQLPLQQPVPPQQPEVKAPAFELVPEPTDQSERSQLGRRVKRMEDSFNTLAQKLDQYFSVPQQQQYQQQQPDDPQQQIISTAADVYRVLENHEKRKEMSRQQYSNEFLKEVQNLSYDNPDLHAEITREMFEVPNSPFNQYRTGNAVADANWNYSRAMAAVLAKRNAKPTVPIPQGGQPSRQQQMATGVSLGTRTQTSTAPPVQLDEFAQRFIQKTGMSMESAQRALSGELPPHLKRNG